MENNAFLWYPRFEKLICSSVGSKSYKNLENMMDIYIKSVSNEIGQCYENPDDAEALKNQVNQVMTFFYFYWLNNKYEIDDYTLYYEKMSKLMTINIDMELITLYKQNINENDLTNESVLLISKFINAFNIYLDNSIDHIITSLLRSKFIDNKYSNIFENIIEVLYSFKNNNTDDLSSKLTIISDETYA